MDVRTILVVEDDPTLRRVVTDALVREGYSVLSAEDGEMGLAMFKEGNFDLVVADIMLPRLDGYEMVTYMRQHNPTAQFLFISALSSSDDVVKGFHVGGHDYIRKPFAMNELIVRVEALLSRLDTRSSASKYRVGKYTLDVQNDKLLCDDGEVIMSPRETAILLALVSNIGRIVSLRTLLINIWGDDSYYNLRSLNVFVSKLRRKLASDTSISIVAVRGVGYKLTVNEV